MNYVMVCVGFANGDPNAPAGQYLKSYDPDAHDGRGWAEWTDNIGTALKFMTTTEAFRLWTAVPACRPTREDGKPNKPLTAFSIMVEPIPHKAA